MHASGSEVMIVPLSLPTWRVLSPYADTLVAKYSISRYHHQRHHQPLLQQHVHKRNCQADVPASDSGRWLVSQLNHVARIICSDTG